MSWDMVGAALMILVPGTLFMSWWVRQPTDDDGYRDERFDDDA